MIKEIPCSMAAMYSVESLKRDLKSSERSQGILEKCLANCQPSEEAFDLCFLYNKKGEITYVGEVIEINGKDRKNHQLGKITISCLPGKKPFIEKLYCDAGKEILLVITGSMNKVNGANGYKEKVKLVGNIV